MVDLRIKSIQRQIELEQTQDELKWEESKNATLNSNMDKLWKAISSLDIKSISKIYEGLKYQGDYVKFAENLKKRYQPEETKTM